MAQVNWKTRVSIFSLAVVGVFGHAQSAPACGCFSPPIPQPEEVNFAVNQQAEQIIFEVEDGFVTAHILIKYAGDPAKFGWLVPVPGVPELSLSYNSLFGLVDQQTAPQVTSYDNELCPQQQYVCETHPEPYCGGALDEPGGSFGGSANGTFSADAGVPLAPTDAPVVQVLSRQTIGAYDTVILAATPNAPNAASAVVTWLNSEGFITNESMAPYMMPYLADGMVFVAAKLVPGAGVDEIRPLKMRYPGTVPMIPLRLTAVAAEPHLPVSAIIYANELFQPMGLPLITLDASQVTNDSFNRVNYPMLLTRSVEDAGAGAFVAEYAGPPPTYQDPTGCCTQGGDWCGVGEDGQCQCPTADFDANDCANQEDIVGAITTAQDLASRFSTVTRLTTRMSPEEMDFDLRFEPLQTKNATFYPNGPLTIQGHRNTLTHCETDVIDDAQYAAITAIQDCSSMYCGQGTCVATKDGGMGCACNDGFVGRKFTDMDGKPSITCVPSVGTVDFSAGGIEIPDVCSTREQLVSGICTPVGGFVTAACDPGFAAVLNTSDLPGCSQIKASSDSPGGLQMTKGIASIGVCAPPAPRCSSDGWLVRLPVSIKGVQCSAAPDPSWFVEPPAPTCPSSSSSIGTSGAFPNNATGSGAGSSSTTEPRPATPMMMDTTAPRPSAVPKSSNKGCAFASDTGRKQGALWAAVVAIALGYRLRSRSGISRC